MQNERFYCFLNYLFLTFWSFIEHHRCYSSADLKRKTTSSWFQLIALLTLLIACCYTNIKLDQVKSLLDTVVRRIVLLLQLQQCSIKRRSERSYHNRCSRLSAVHFQIAQVYLQETFRDKVLVQATNWTPTDKHIITRLHVLGAVVFVNCF